MHSEYSVARAALDSLSCLAYSYKTIKEVDEIVIEHIVETLCNNIIKTIVDSQINRNFGVKGKIIYFFETLREKLTSLFSSSETIVADHFYCLLDWLMYGHPYYLFDKPELANKLCQAIELGLVGQKALSAIPSVQVPEKEVSKSKDKSKDKKKRMSVRETPEKQDSKKVVDEEESSSRLNPSHGSVIICEAAEILWVHLLSFLQNFPSRDGIDLHSSLVTEQVGLFSSFHQDSRNTDINSRTITWNTTHRRRIMYLTTASSSLCFKFLILPEVGQIYLPQVIHSLKTNQNQRNFCSYHS